MKWIFIYGPGRTGSTYLLRLIREVSLSSVSDWGLGSILSPLVKMVGGIDKDRFLRDLASNILDSSKRNDNGQLDLVIKSASGNAEELECYQKMFGVPQKIIFTIREPSGYMASAVKKFPDHDIENLRHSYLQMMSLYPTVGGHIFNYGPDLGLSDYLKFLYPLDFSKVQLENFEYKGSQADHLVTTEMKSSYLDFLDRFKKEVFGR